VTRTFISYGSEDRALVMKLDAALTARGHSVWWDRDLSAGDTFRAVIDAELAKAEAVVVIWTKTSVEKDWVNAEAADALRRRRLAPVVFANPRDFDIPLVFREQTFLDLSGWEGDAQGVEIDLLDRALNVIEDGRYKDAIAELSQKAFKSVKGGDQALKVVMAFGGTIGGLPIRRYVAGSVAVGVITAAIMASAEFLLNEGQVSMITLDMLMFGALAGAVARACAQFIYVSKGLNSRVFFDERFSFWATLCLLLGVFLLLVETTKLPVDNLRWSLKGVLFMLTGLYVGRVFVTLGQKLAARI
jgi:hypothetical protein